MDDPINQSIDTATGEPAESSLSTERVFSIFSKIAKRYEAFNAISSMGAYKLWLDKMASLVDAGPASAVLDIAGGTGDVTFTVAKKCRPAIIVCTDLVPEMLEVAKDHSDHGASDGVPVTFMTADGQELPFDDDTFDTVTMAYGLRNMPEREKALKEIFRVLRPGGQYVCLDFSTPPNILWRAAYDLYLKHMIPLIGRMVTGDDSGFIYLANSIKAFPDQAGIAEMMRDAGYEDVSWHDCAGGIACIHVCYKPGDVAELARRHA